MNGLIRFLTDDEAATSVEYAVMLGLILVTMVATIRSVGATSGGMWENNRSELQAHGF